MIAVYVMTAALAAGGYEPVAAEVYKVPGPAFQIPCKVDRAESVARVQIWVSANQGKTWEQWEEFAPDTSAFTYSANRPGEYWFAPRLKTKDGTFIPADAKALVPQCRVAVATGSESESWVPVQPTAGEVVSELDNELTRVELTLIRKELKRLAEEKALTPDVEIKIDRLRGRLREARDRLNRSDYRLPPATTLPTLPTLPIDQLLPSINGSEPLTVPLPVPARPVAPLPRVPARR